MDSEIAVASSPGAQGRHHALPLASGRISKIETKRCRVGYGALAGIARRDGSGCW